ncbi:hypothetical protein [Marinicella meishanensis]|uniref:hypothetical protein n=1 Tax=Marinicella meishanensis TaxID=2873263 RepID=UPI001CBE0E09|nr:hypothetical protein [Marinicella sp. NBU2979]
MKKLLNILMVMALMSFTSAALAEPSSTEVVQAQLDQVDVGNRSLVVAGNTYRFKMDAENSSYRSEQDQANGLELRDLKPGNVYFFEMIIRGENKRSARFSDIIFISESAPSE